MSQLTLLSRETESETDPLYSSGYFMASVCMRLTAAVTTPCTESGTVTHHGSLVVTCLHSDTSVLYLLSAKCISVIKQIMKSVCL